MKIQMLIALLTLALLGLAKADGPPSHGGGYSVERYSMDAGGGVIGGGSFEVHATIAQHDADQTMSGGVYAVEGGFWAGHNNPRQTLYRDSFE